MSQFRAQFTIDVYGVNDDDMTPEQEDDLAEEFKLAAAMFADSIKRINDSLQINAMESFC